MIQISCVYLKKNYVSACSIKYLYVLATAMSSGDFSARSQPPRVYAADRDVKYPNIVIGS